MQASDSEESLVRRAETCDDCLCWLEYCEAECCSQIRFRLNPQSDVVFAEDVVRIHIRMTPDLRKYLELHRITLEGDVMVVPRENCTVSPNRIEVRMHCTALQNDFLCQLHPDGKPEGCKRLTWETAQDRNYFITPRCLYAYKLKALSAHNQNSQPP